MQAPAPATAPKPKPTSVLPSLTDGPVPLLPLRDHLESTLISTITKLLSRSSLKALILPSKTIGRALNYNVSKGAAGLKTDLNITTFADLHTPEPQSIPFPGQPNYPDDIIVMASSTSISEVTAVASWIKARQSALAAPTSSNNPFDHETYTILLLPHTTALSSKLLSVVSSVASIHSLSLDLVPFDSDILSLSYPSFLKTVSVNGCTEQPFTDVAESIMVVQSVFGCIPNVKGIGNKAKGVIEKLVEFRNETTALYNDDDDEQDVPPSSSSTTSPPPPSIDTLVVIDREVDFVTPLLTPLTYEGLIDQIIGIQSGYIKVDEAILGQDDSDTKDAKNPDSKNPFVPSSKVPKLVTLPLNSSSPLFNSIRNQNIEQLGSFLHNQAKMINNSYTSFRSNANASISEIHSFVKLIPGLTQNQKSLEQHINIAEYIKSHTGSMAFRNTWQTERSMLEGETNYAAIETAIADEVNYLDVLKLLCLQSLTGGGIKSGKYDSIRRDLIQTYGFKLLPLLNNLESLGAIKRQKLGWTGGGMDWSTLRRQFQLIVDDVDVNNPTDISYVSSGYAPLSVRLLQAVVKSNEAVSNVVSVTELYLEEDTFVTFEDAAKRGRRRGEGGRGGGREEKKVMMVYFMGGISYLEIAALRFLSNSAKFPFRIVIATTKIENGSAVLENLA